MPSARLNVGFLKSFGALSYFVRAYARTHDYRLRGFRGLYHTCASSGKKESTPAMMAGQGFRQADRLVQAR